MSKILKPSFILPRIIPNSRGLSKSNIYWIGNQYLEFKPIKSIILIIKTHYPSIDSLKYVELKE